MDVRGSLKKARRRLAGGPPRQPDRPKERAASLPPLDGDGNRIRCHDSLIEGRDFFLTVNGQGNRLDIARPTTVGRLAVHLEGGARVSIGPGCVFDDLFVYAARGARIEIGTRVGFNGRVRLLAHEPQSITIGDECLFAGNVDVSVSDMHAILDRATGRRVNPGRGIRLGSRVWIGQGAMVLKGVTLGDGAIVGAMSLVTRDVPAHCIAAGSPARVIRRGVDWRYDLESPDAAAPAKSGRFGKAVARAVRRVRKALSGPSPPQPAAEPEAERVVPGMLRLHDLDLPAMVKVAKDGGYAVREILRLRSVMVELPPTPALAAALKTVEIREPEQHITWRQTLYASAEVPLFSMTGAIAHSSAGIIGVDGSVIAETLWNTHPDMHHYWRDGDSILIHDVDIKNLDGAHISLLTGSSDDYFHMVVDSAARLSVVPEAVLETARGILIPAGAPLLAELLAIYGLPPGPEVRAVSPSETFRVEALIAPGSLHGVFSFHPRLSDFFERIRRGVPRTEGGGLKRVYVDHRGSGRRRLVNEDAVIAALAPFGFEPVRLEGLSAARQVAVFRDAEAIVSPHGSGLTNVGFVDHDCVVIELMMDSCADWRFRRIAALRHAQYDCVFGRAPKPWPKLDPVFHATIQGWEIAVDETVAVVREALRRRGLRERPSPDSQIPQPDDPAPRADGGPSRLQLRVADMAAMARDGGPLREILRWPSAEVALPPMPAVAEAVTRMAIREPEPHIAWGQTSYASAEVPLFSVANALSHGSAGIAAADGAVIYETLWHTHPDTHGYTRDGDAVSLPARGVETLEGAHLSLLCGGADNYFHAMIESAARLSIPPEALIETARSILVPDDGMALRELLDLYGPPPGVALRAVSRSETFRVEELILPGSLHGVFNFHPRLNAFFDRIRSRAPRGKAPRPRRVYVDRRGSPLRRLVNEGAVVAALEPLGFSPVRLESLSAHEQVALFRDAEAIVSPHGAGLTNLGFAERGCVVVELMMDAYVNWCFRRVAALREARYDCVFGRAQTPWAALDPQFHSQTWEISAPETAAAVRRSLAAAGLPERR